MQNALGELFDNAGHVVFNKKGYRKKAKLFPLDYSIENADKAVRDIRGIDAVESVRTSISFGALTEGTDYSIPVVCMGISLKKGPTVRRYKRSLIAGRMPEPGAYEVVLGDKLAGTLGKKTGDNLILMLQDYYGSPNPAELTVSGIHDTRIKMEKESMVIMPEAAAREILHLPGDTITIQVNLSDERMVPALTHRFRRVAEKHGLEIETYLERFASFLKWIPMADFFTWVISIIVVGVAATSIVNTVLTSVFERFRDFGTMRAIGLRKFDLFLIIIIEAAFNSLMAVMIANAVSIPVLRYFSINGVDMGDAMNIVEGVSSRLYMAYNADIFIAGSLVGILSGIVSAAYPALMAIRKKPVETLRFV